METQTHSQFRTAARRIFYTALRAVDPSGAVNSAVRAGDDWIEVGGERLPLPRSRKMLVVGAGKGSALMADALEVLFGERITGGQVTVKDKHGIPLRRILVGEAGHPTPDRRGQAQAEQIIRMMAGKSDDDLVISVISGGGSALWPSPAPGLTLADKMQMTSMLLACGATIGEMNCVRKHLSRIKGGQLARAAMPATVISLILSDVIGDRLDAIASGPTAPDPTTYADAFRVIQERCAARHPPRNVIDHLKNGMRGRLPETPKPGDPCFAKVHNVVVGNNKLALRAAEQEAERLGFHPVVVDRPIQGEARRAVTRLLTKARSIRKTGRPVPVPACIVAGGETTVDLGNSTGIGGRNQEMALDAAIKIEDEAGIVFLAGGTDGTDGPTDAAGAVVDGATVRRGQKLNHDARQALANHDAYSYFSNMDEHIITGPTLTNVMDIYLVLVT